MLTSLTLLLTSLCNVYPHFLPWYAVKIDLCKGKTLLDYSVYFLDFKGNGYNGVVTLSKSKIVDLFSEGVKRFQKSFI